jgi:hypothetical protein
MKLTINGADRSGELGATPPQPEVAASARRLQQPADEAAYLDELIRQLQQRNVVNLEPFQIPRRSGWLGALTAKVRTKLWRLLRYQHEHVTAQQNDINQLLAAALEFEHRAHQREVAALTKRIEELERKLAAR